MHKTRIAVLTGGYSAEWKISLQTGKTVIDNLNLNEEFEALELRVLKDGWHVIKGEDQFEVDQSDLSWMDASATKQKFDLAFMAIHGNPGEDGVFQGYLESMGIPLAGSGVFASSFTFNKAQTNAYAARLGAPVAKSYIHLKGEPLDEEAIDKLGYPIFVKPNRSGSSFGISRVSKKEELQPAIDEALRFDQIVVIETGISGMELGCGLSNHNGKPEVLGITEVVPKNVFFDYHSKYSGESQEITPARISQSAQRKVEELSLLLYKHFELNAIARIDYILDKEETPWLIEINSVPGMSSESIVPKQIQAGGLKMSDIFGKIARRCLNQE